MGYTVLGAGAIGGTLAHFLASAGHPVTVVDADEAHVAAIRDHGLMLLQPGGAADTVRVAAAYTTTEAAERGVLHERVLLATKAQHVASAARWLAPFLAPDGFALLCQNRDTFADAASSLGVDRTASAFVNFAADVLEPGVIRTGGPGDMAIGEYDGRRSTRVDAVVADLSAFGHVVATDDISGFLWSKRGIAAVLTATALVDEHVSVVIDSSRDVMAELVTEVYAVADARGVRLVAIDGIEPWSLVTTASAADRSEAFDRLVAFTGSMTGKERSGVFRDIAVRKRPTEARPDLEALSALGRQLGIPTPYLDTLAALIGELETGARSFGRENLDELRRSTP